MWITCLLVYLLEQNRLTSTALQEKQPITPLEAGRAQYWLTSQVTLSDLFRKKAQILNCSASLSRNYRIVIPDHLLRSGAVLSFLKISKGKINAPLISVQDTFILI